MKLSAYIICKNEAAVIARCINRFKNAVDEIVVVDSGSTDNTVEIARNLGAVIYSIEWQDDFSYARNFALQKCSGDWIIPLDADEYFREGDAEKVLNRIKILETKKSPYDGLICKLSNIDPATSKSISQMTHLLAFRNTSDLKYHRTIHEELKKGNNQLNLRYVDDIIIFHTGYILSKEQLENKTLRNTLLLEKLIENGNADASDYLHLTQLYLGSNKSADEIYNVAKKMVDLDKINGAVPNTVAYRKYTLWAMALQKKNYPFAEIIKVLDTALIKFPLHPEVFAARGDAFLSAKKLDYAILEYENALKAERAYNDILSNSFTGKIPKIRLLLSELYMTCNNPVKALEHCFELLKQDKYNMSATILLLHLIRSQTEADIVIFLDTFYDRNKEKDLKYLVSCLTYIRIPKLFNYYEKIWRTKFGGQDASIISALLCLGDYKSAVNIAQNYLINHPNAEISSMFYAGIVLGNLYEDYKISIINSDKGGHEVLEAIYQLRLRKPIDIFRFELNQLIRVLYHLVQSLSDDNALRYIEDVVFSNNRQIIQLVVNDLLYVRRYLLLSKLYNTCAQTDEIQRGQNLFLSGMYLMMNGSHKDAMGQFIRAEKCGFNSLEMQEYMRIINSAKCNLN